jgi:hypothetical protein
MQRSDGDQSNPWTLIQRQDSFDCPYYMRTGPPFTDKPRKAALSGPPVTPETVESAVLKHSG